MDEVRGIIGCCCVCDTCESSEEIVIIEDNFLAVNEKNVEQRKPRVAFVSVLGIPCGIATYNSALLTELQHYADIQVFAEYADEKQSERLNDDPAWVTRCWNRLAHPKRKLLSEIAAYKPDVVHFSHEYGLFPKAQYFTGLISAIRKMNIPVVSTMHSVYPHLDKTVQEASADHLIVHTAAAKACLVKKGVEDSKISVIPHGSAILKGTDDHPELLPALWNTWGTKYTIFQPGFLFDYKGHLRMLDIVAKLKHKYPDIHYIIQGSQNPNNMIEHDELYDKIVKRCEELGITENVTVNLGFVDQDVLLANIRTCKCCVLPYNNHPEHDVRATSGIARLVLATETPLVVSGVHLFDDLEGVVPRGYDNDEIYDHIDHIFTSDKWRDEQIKARLKFIRKTAWSNIAYTTSCVYQELVAK